MTTADFSRPRGPSDIDEKRSRFAPVPRLLLLPPPPPPRGLAVDRAAVNRADWLDLSAAFCPAG